MLLLGALQSYSDLPQGHRRVPEGAKNVCELKGALCCVSGQTEVRCIKLVLHEYGLQNK